MPGLFGLIRIGGDTRLTKPFVQNAIDVMVHALSHRRDYVVDIAVSEMQGFAIGRISHPSADGHRWPRPQEMVGARQSKAFLHGVFTKDCTMNLSQERLNGLPSSAVEILRDLEGYYSLVLTHQNFHSVIISVDRKGSEPLFYLQQNGIVFFAPEVKALLAICDNRLELNPEAIPMFLSCGHLLGDQTLLSSIKRLPGGSYLQIQKNVIERKSYWTFRPGEEVSHNTEQELQEELIELLKASVRKNIGDPAKTIIFLSGGLDSRGILAGALINSCNTGQQLNTVTWGLADNIPGSDAAIAEQIAKKFNLRHTFFQRKANKYADAFEETNYITDGLSDIAAFHPHEFTIMKQIKEMGFDRVLRGDETFGWHGRVYNYKEAEAEVGLRTIRKIALYSKILRPKYYREWSDGSDASMARLENDISGMDPTDAKDYLYFTHRLQGYLNSCGSYKQVLFDHRNVFLDDSILDFLLRTPWQLRLNKELYRKALFAMYPSLNSIPLADYSGLENWNDELTRQTEMRKFMQQQLDDANSGIWEYFDRNAVATVFHSLSSSPINPLSSSFRTRLRRKISGHIFSLFPRQAEQIRTKRFQSAIMPYEVLLRFLVLKNWHDTFIEGKRHFNS